MKTRKIGLHCELTSTHLQQIPEELTSPMNALRIPRSGLTQWFRQRKGRKYGYVLGWWMRRSERLPDKSHTFHLDVEYDGCGSLRIGCTTFPPATSAIIRHWAMTAPKTSTKKRSKKR